MVAAIDDAVENLKPLNMPIEIADISLTLIVDSASAHSILHQSFIPLMVENTTQASFWVNEMDKH